MAACVAYAQILADAIAGHSLGQILDKHARECVRIDDLAVRHILSGSWRGRHRKDVLSSGYVVNSLEAALWSVARSGSFEEAVLTAANLGEDADSTAAITGQLAGALNGIAGIPEQWRSRVAWKHRIKSIACRLFNAGSVEDDCGACTERVGIVVE